jgi:hypothetical protein
MSNYVMIDRINYSHIKLSAKKKKLPTIISDT